MYMYMYILQETTAFLAGYNWPYITLLHLSSPFTCPLFPPLPFFSLSQVRYHFTYSPNSFRFQYFCSGETSKEGHIYQQVTHTYNWDAYKNGQWYASAEMKTQEQFDNVQGTPTSNTCTAGQEMLCSMTLNQ